MSRRFNRGGDNDTDYLRCLLSGTVAPNNVSIAACFARELDDANFQTLAQMGNAGVDTSRAILGIPSSSDTIRAAQINAAGTAAQASTTGAVTNQRFYVGCGRFVSATSRTAERTGIAVATNTTSNTPGTFSELLIGRKSVVSAGFESWPGWLQWVAFWRVAISAAESVALCQQWEDPRKIRPDGLIALVDFKDYRPIYYTPRNSLLFNVVGDPDWESYGPYTIRTKRRRIFVPGVTAVTGTLAATEGPDVAAIAGEVEVTGNLAATEGSDVAAISGEVDVSGDLAVTEAQDVAAIAGEVDVSGDLAATEGADVADISGELGEILIEGDLDATEDQDTAAIDGVVLVQGDLASTEEPDIAALAGEVDVSGDLDAQEDADTAAISGEVAVSGDLSANEEADVAAMAGEVPVSGSLDVTEEGDAPEISGSVLVQGDLDASEEPDVAAFNGSSHIVGNLSVTEEPDVAGIAGRVMVWGELSALEAADQAAAAGVVLVSGDLSVDDAPDTASVEGELGTAPVLPIEGDLSVTEASDIAAIAGELAHDHVGHMAAVEGRDTCAIAGHVAQVIQAIIARPGLPYQTVEARRFGINVGPYDNTNRQTVNSKAGDVSVDVVENIETSAPHSIVPGQ